MMGKVDRNSKMKFFWMASLALILLSAFITSCSKHNVAPTPPPTDTTSTYHDPAQYGTPFASVPNTTDIVMYEVNIQTYTPATFQGVTARLDSIKSLGVNVIWLMPTYPVGALKSINSPYCVQNYNGVNPNFGALADLRNLVAAAHSLGMAVIMDWVANDTSWDNPWITANPTWYLQNASGTIISPPNTTYTDVAALNFNNTAMRAAMIRAMKFWIYTANVDGYRCDFADNVPANFWSQALDTLNTITTHKLIYLAEGTTAAEISAGFQLGYAFSYYSTLTAVYAGTQSPGSIFTTNSTEIASLPSTGIKLRYTTNHDDASTASTLTAYNGQQGALSAFVLAACMDGVPLIYDSQEVGYPNTISIFTDVPVNYNANPNVVAAYKQIIAFRNAHQAVKTGTLTTYNDPNVAGFEKVSGTDDVLILVNTQNSAVNYSIPAILQNTSWINGLSGAGITLNSQYTLQPYSFLILSKN